MIFGVQSRLWPFKAVRYALRTFGLYNSGLPMRNLLKALVVALLFSNSCFASISLDEAAKQIIEGTYNKVLGAQTEVIDGRDVHVIKVLTPDGRIQYYKIDAETGQLVS